MKTTRVTIDRPLVFLNGRAPVVSESGQYRVYGSNGPIGYSDEFNHEQAIILGRVGAYCGSVAICHEPFWASDNTIVVKPTGQQSLRYWYYRLLTLPLRNFAGGAAQPLLTHTILRGVEADIFADAHDQQRIADILSAYDDLIENNRRRMALLEDGARQLYREWFVRLRFPGHEHTRITNSVPEGWRHANFLDFVDFLEGPGLRNHQYRDEGIPFLNIRTIKDDDVDFSKVKYLDENEVEARYQHFLLQENDHVVSSSGTLGRVVTIRAVHLPLMLNTSLIRMRPKSYIGRWFIKAYLKHGDYLSKVTSMATGAAQLNYGPMHLNQLRFIVPPPMIAALFEEQAEAMYEEIKVLLDTNSNLRAARDLLLPRLMSGEIAV